MLPCSMMANCKLSNMELEFDDKIKENEQLAWALGVGKQPILLEPCTERKRMVQRREQKRRCEIWKGFSPLTVFLPGRVIAT